MKELHEKLTLYDGDHGSNYRIAKFKATRTRTRADIKSLPGHIQLGSISGSEFDSP